MEPWSIVSLMLPSDCESEHLLVRKRRTRLETKKRKWYHTSTQRLDHLFFHCDVAKSMVTRGNIMRQYMTKGQSTNTSLIHTVERGLIRKEGKWEIIDKHVSHAGHVTLTCLSHHSMRTNSSAGRPNGSGTWLRNERTSSSWLMLRWAKTAISDCMTLVVWTCCILLRTERRRSSRWLPKEGPS